MKLKNKLYIIIKNCDSKTAWYSDKIGTIQYVTDDLFPDYGYNTIDALSGKGPYPIIEKKDVEIITPTLMEKFLCWLKIN